MATQRLKRRVVVTGIGAVTPLGLTFTDSWAALLQNRSGAVTLREALLCQNLTDDRLEQELVTAQALPCQVAAPVQNFVSSDARTSRFVQLALAAATEAVSSAGLTDWWANNISTAPEAIQRQQRAGVSIGSGMSGVREIADAVRMMDTLGYRKLSPHFVPKVLGNSAAARVSLLYGLRGSNWTASTACAAGSHAIGDAARCIQTGQADIMLAGGAESCIDPLSLAGFCRLRALSTAFNEDPAAASRPFDVNRDGFVMGEGACVLVLEELEHAMERLSSSKGAAFVELIGYGATGDAHHITSPDPDGRGAVEAMKMAVNEAGIDAASIQYVNAHATSTPKGDEIEARAIHHAVCGGATREHSVFVSSTKGATGHLLGAAGAIEAAFTVQALLDQQIPPTRNLVQVESEISQLQGLTCVRGDAMKKYTSNEFDVAMSNSFGFGGTNASLIFRRIRVSDC
jgi:3-oxoacyl-[acyl-carrier-protein] synthase II